MATNPRQRLAKILAGTGPAGSFSARLSAPAHLLGLDVADVGPVKLPLRAPLARKLIAVARPAKFGRGEQTLSDTSIRDTWELTPDQLTLDGAGWNALLEQALEYFRDKLGLPVGTRLRARPHAMLVYGKGQFFLPHQDSEKDDTMLGTLVVSLPSAHTGGELIIEHAGQSVTFRGSKDELTLVAFYADCRHQVTPVTSGYRHTITFDLLAETAPRAADTEPAADAARCLTEHFTHPATPRYGGRPLPPPIRLVFLLDHEYTQRGLAWHRLKGTDAERAALLRAAAGQAGCETALALTEVKETWDAQPEGGCDPWNDYGHDDEEGEGDGADEQRANEEYELGDLIDDETTLTWWNGPDGTGGETVSLYIRDHEICTATPSAHLTAYRSEYEGYMGNYGNTLDRWYRRAAVVVWPREKAFTARAEAEPARALRELRDRVTAGDLPGAREAAHSLAPFWHTVEPDSGLLTAALEAASALDAAETAAMILKPFPVERLASEHAEALATACRRYGGTWTRKTVAGWFDTSPHPYGTSLPQWIEDTLPALCRALHHTSSAQTARLLTAGAWNRLEQLLRHATATARADLRRPQSADLSAPLAALLSTADTTQRDKIAAALRTYPETILECLVPALRQASTHGTADDLGPLVHDCAQRLSRIAATPPRDRNDWSITWTGCGCDLCDRLTEFLGSQTRRRLEWPLAKDGRRHVHSRIDTADLPVRHQTRREGRPYTLVLTKTDALFTRATLAREQAATDLAWLTTAYRTSHPRPKGASTSPR